jgi:hypothetical protein
MIKLMGMRSIGNVARWKRGEIDIKFQSEYKESAKHSRDLDNDGKEQRNKV